MLTRDLLRFDLRQQKIIPRFLDPQDRTWQEAAKGLAMVYESGTGYSREELTELTQPILNGTRSPLVAKGLNKLLLDRCTFQESDSTLEEFRMQIFTSAAQQFQNREGVATGERGTPYSLELFRQTVAATMGLEADLLAARLYGDLPARQLLLSFSPTLPESLLHRYNLAQAQGLLWWARELLVETREADVRLLRPFFRYLKFFRLLARIQRTPEGGFLIRLDGPLSLFDNSRKYGILLADFLPAVCALQQWRIQAWIEVPVSAAPFPPTDRRHRSGAALLELDDSRGLRSHFTQTGSHLPEEFERFAQLFGQQVTDWSLQESPDVLELDKQEWVVPDFSFRHQSGQMVHLELFHRWHAPQLQRRLQSLSRMKRTPPHLVIGVDRFLLKQADIALLLQDSPWYQQHGFPFNAFPPVKRVVASLHGFLPPATPGRAAVS
ncbi:MAG: DUF790 family protein [Magnetococcus sp. MYC-9]